MSLERRLKQATEEAKQAERGRCLWVIDEIENEIQAGIDNRLATPKELHVMKTKLRIFLSLSQKIKRGIVTGVEPKGPTER